MQLLGRWAVAIDVLLPPPSDRPTQRTILSWHLTRRGAEMRCRRNLRPLAVATALMPPGLVAVRIVPVR